MSPSNCLWGKGFFYLTLGFFLLINVHALGRKSLRTKINCWEKKTLYTFYINQFI